MFRNFIYLDTDKLYTYKRQIEGEISPTIKSVKKTKNRGVEANLATISVQAQDQISAEAEIEKDTSFDYDRFELALSAYEGEDYFDFVLNTDYTFLTLPVMKLIRLENSFSIPNEFDMINLIEQFKPYLIGQFETKNLQEHEALHNLFNNTSTDIPIIIETDEITISSKLNLKYLKEEYTELEDYETQNVFMLCRVVGIIQKETVEIYNPLKDFIKLPRSLRRSMDFKGNDIGLSPIKVLGPVLKVEIIAIYK